MKRIMLLAVITGALMVPATAGANGGIGAGASPLALPRIPPRSKSSRP